MSIERSFYLIRDEAKAETHKIRRAVMESGLTLSHIQLVKPNKELIQLLNPSASLKEIASIYRHLKNSQCEIGVVEGKDAVMILAEINGRNPNPILNGIGTIRRRHTSDVVMLHKKYPYRFCSTDCPQSVEDALRGLELLSFF